MTTRKDKTSAISAKDMALIEKMARLGFAAQASPDGKPPAELYKSLSSARKGKK